MNEAIIVELKPWREEQETRMPPCNNKSNFTNNNNNANN